VVAHLSSIKIKISIRLIADLASERHTWRNLPIEAPAGPNLAVRQDRMIKPRYSVRAPEIVIHTVTGLLHIRPYVKGEVLVHLILETGSRQHGFKQPQRCDFPANSGNGDNRIFPLDIDAHSQNELQAGTINVGAADEERKIKIVVP